MSALPESSSLQMSKMIEICSSTLWKKRKFSKIWLQVISRFFKNILQINTYCSPALEPSDGAFSTASPLKSANLSIQLFGLKKRIKN